MTDDKEYQQQVLNSLQKSVRGALERKYRLGQYAVIWRDGHPQRVEGEALKRLYDAPGCSRTAGGQGPIYTNRKANART